MSLVVPPVRVGQTDLSESADWPGQRPIANPYLPPMGSVRHVAVAGNMGVGKSTLTEVLSQRLQARAFYESVDANPFLERFYGDMTRWAYLSQFTFLTQAFQQHCEILASDTVCVQDRTIYEHYHVFARSQHAQGMISDDDFEHLTRTYESFTDDVAQDALKPPDVLIYLRASVQTLQNRIRSRDRTIEHGVDAAYLEHLEEHYEAFIDAFANQVDAARVLVIETDGLDIHVDADREDLLAIIDAHIDRTGRALTLA